MSQPPSIPDFYNNKNVFITGGSGFIGKVLIEKLLRSCPNLKTIYLLMRPKKGKTPEERIKSITDLPLFNVLKTQNPGFLTKIKLVNGDVRELGLGLNHEDTELLIQEINIVFNVAASVRFDDSLTDAIIMNTRGTREVVSLGLRMKNLEVLEHISTTYCHTDHDTIEEKWYPPHADWQKSIEIAEKVDRDTLNGLTEKYIHPLPNTYTFTKSLAEHVVYDLCHGKIPAVIYRPSVVISSVLDPFPGWIDNFNGPMGLVAAFGKGIVRTVYSDPDVVTDYVPVDLTVKAMIISSWKQANLTTMKLTPSFYNGSNCDNEPVSTKVMLQKGKRSLETKPLDYIVWPLGCTFTKCFYWYYIQMVLYHLVPAVLIDLLLRLLGQKPMLVRLHRRIYMAVIALSHFTLNQWKFCNDTCFHLDKEILPGDLEAFSYNEDQLDVDEFFHHGVIGIRKYLLKEGDDLEGAKRHMARMTMVKRIVTILWYLGLLWVFSRTNFASRILFGWL